MQTKRIYVDSRYRLAGGTDTDFRFALKTPVEIERGTLGWIDGVVIPNVFNTVKICYNDQLFARVPSGPRAGNAFGRSDRSCGANRRADIFCSLTDDRIA